MLPDGIFVSTLGMQGINAHFRNKGGSASDQARVYLESVDDPGIVVTPVTYPVNPLSPGASELFTWQANFSGASPGKHLISFIVQTSAASKRLFARIFVASVQFDPATKTFTGIVPEGQLAVQFVDLVGTTQPCGCDCDSPSTPIHEGVTTMLAREFVRATKDGKSPACGPFLPHQLVVNLVPDAPYTGQYGDLPFGDPWWKLVLCLIALILAAAAAVVQGLSGSGDLTVSGGTSGGGEDGTKDCCGIRASGGGTSPVAAGLLAAAAAVATAAGLSDVRDPFRRGQDHTNTHSGVLTTSENLKAKLIYLESVQLGKPFAIGAQWTYTRSTTAGDLTYTVDETQNNVHVLSSYEITAPDVVRSYKREPFIVQAQFLASDGTLFKGAELFVQCFLTGPNGRFDKFVLQDNGAGGRFGDAVALDGVYTGGYQFTVDDRGMWTFLVIAQDVNNANPDMTPDQAAQIIGGMVLTHQLTISFEGGTCPLVPDGHVNVI